MAPRYELRKNFFSNRIVNMWNSLPDYVVIISIIIIIIIILFFYTLLPILLLLLLLLLLLTTVFILPYAKLQGQVTRSVVSRMIVQTDKSSSAA